MTLNSISNTMTYTSVIQPASMKTYKKCQELDGTLLSRPTNVVCEIQVMPLLSWWTSRIGVVYAKFEEKVWSLVECQSCFGALDVSYQISLRMKWRAFESAHSILAAILSSMAQKKWFWFRNRSVKTEWLWKRAPSTELFKHLSPGLSFSTFWFYATNKFYQLHTRSQVEDLCSYETW